MKKPQKQSKALKPKKMSRVPEEVAAIRREIQKFFQEEVEPDKPLRNWYGVYCFYDYDGEPIYVGQSEEGLGSRVGRHLTNQRTDAVAMSVLDPFEVATIEAWPLAYPPKPTDKTNLLENLSALEYSVFQSVLMNSALGAVLNEKDLKKTKVIKLPMSFRRRIVPEDVFTLRSHPDIRIARRAGTIARLAQVISERDVSAGLRRTLVTQAKRLERLAAQRFKEAGGVIPIEEPGEDTGDESGKRRVGPV